MESLHKFRTELVNAIRNHYRQLTSRFPDIYGYAIYSVTGLPYITAVAQRESSLEVEPGDDQYDYFRYFANEWSEQDDFGLFDGVKEALAAFQDEHAFVGPESYTQLLDTCLEVLCQLEEEGLFGPRTDSRFLCICVFDTDEEYALESAKRLNTPATYEAFASQL